MISNQSIVFMQTSKDQGLIFWGLLVLSFRQVQVFTMRVQVTHMIVAGVMCEGRGAKQWRVQRNASSAGISCEKCRFNLPAVYVRPARSEVLACQPCMWGLRGVMSQTVSSANLCCEGCKCNLPAVYVCCVRSADVKSQDCSSKLRWEHVQPASIVMHNLGGMKIQPVWSFGICYEGSS